MNCILIYLKKIIRPLLWPARAFFLRLTRCTCIQSREHFDKMSNLNNVPGLRDVRVCKFIITGIDRKKPILYFMETNKDLHHYQNYRRMNNCDISEQEFNSFTYYSNARRKVLAGSIVAYDHYEDPDTGRGIFTIEYFPTDPINFEFAQLSWDLISQAMPFTGKRLRYYLGSQTQIAQFESERSLFENSKLKLIDSNRLFNNLDYIPLNLGETFGILRMLDTDEVPAAQDIVIFRSLPNDLSHVNGIITDIMQTPLSHVNLKARQNMIPNVYIKNASSRKDITKLIGKAVRFCATGEGYELEEISMDVLEAKSKPIMAQAIKVPAINLKQQQILSLKNIVADDCSAFGGKAANLGELMLFLDKKYIIQGHAIPFYLYDIFMQHNSFYPKIKNMLKDNKFLEDNQYRNRVLGELRDTISHGKLTTEISTKLRDMHSEYSNCQGLRLRSSSNSEDLENFNGAGLYESYAHAPVDGSIENTVKSVWSSMWTYRAFEERQFYQIDHKEIFMAILVHPDLRNEQYNGVIVTKNLYSDIYDGFYINVQAGTALVTNPDKDALPDELIVSATGENKEYEIQYIHHSNLIAPENTVMSDAQIMELIEVCQQIHNHFKVYYKAEQNNSFAMEIEFLNTSDGVLKIMQARPWQK